jgi:predicted ATPase
MASSQWRESFQDLRIVLIPQGDTLAVTLTHLGEEKTLASATLPSPDFARLTAAYLRPLRQGVDLPAADQEEFGRELGDLLLPPPIRKALLPLRHQGALRLRIQAEAPWSSLPWEFAYVEGGFLGHQSDLCLVREADPIAAGVPEDDGPSRRVLLAWANPNSDQYPDLPALEAETKSVGKALSAPECRSLKVDTLPYATLSTFVRTLQRQPVDIVNFIGHGDQRPSGGVIILEGSRPGEHDEVAAEDLLPALRAARVRLVVLSSCFTATPGRGMAASLVAGGVPAVVAMQFPWDDQTARLFSRAFYGALAEGSAIEDALFQGRIAIRGSGAHWAVPVLTVSSRPSLRPAAPPIKVHTNNLPAEDWPFIGRTQELKNLQKAVKDGRRLITLTGSGGMGKTRLARQFARQVLSKYPDGVWLVDCEPLASEDDLRGALAVVPGLEGATQTWTTISEAIGDRRMLLVLDCFERLVLSARALTPLIAGNPNLQLLVTSRRLLGLPREHEVAVQPLSLAKRRGGKADGTELFQTAASYADPDIGKSEEDRALIDALVRDLEAVPLAIVLAAGRLRYLSLAELRKRLESNLFEALQGEEADYSQVIQASFDLLGPAELDLAERLCVFHGGFSHRDVEAVLGADKDLDARIRVLRDHSILIAQNAGERKRFRILDAVREHVGRREGSEAKMEEIRRRHADHFAQRAAEVREASNAGSWQRANRELSQDAANFRAAIRYATETRSKPLIRSFAQSLARMYLEAGARSDFDLITIPANQHAETDGDVRLRIELAGLEGALHRRERDFARARDVWLIRARLAQDLGDFDATADSLLDVADLALERGDLDAVEALLLRVEGIAAQIKSTPLRASAALLSAKLALRRGQPERALTLARGAYASIEDCDGDPLAMYVWISLSQVFLAVGSLPDSERTCRRLILESIRCGYVHYMGRALLALSAIREAAGRTEDAALAAAIAMRIPPSASRSLRSEAVQRSRALAERHGARLMKTAGERAKVAPESDLAMSLVDEDFRDIR